MLNSPFSPCNLIVSNRVSFILLLIPLIFRSVGSDDPPNSPDRQRFKIRQRTFFKRIKLLVPLSFWLWSSYFKDSLIVGYKSNFPCFFSKRGGIWWSWLSILPTVMSCREYFFFLISARAIDVGFFFGEGSSQPFFSNISLLVCVFCSVHPSGTFFWVFVWWLIKNNFLFYIWFYMYFLILWFFVSCHFTKCWFTTATSLGTYGHSTTYQ